jgi:D-alanyl-D-alanine carboxypeptidase
MVSIQAALDDFVARTGSPGGIVAVSSGAGPVVVVTSGLSDRRNGTPMPNDPRFYTGKIAGLFVTAVALQLVGEGRLDLDAPLATYLPDAPSADILSVRHLLEHTSGFDDWLLGGSALNREIADLVAQDPDRHIPTQEIVDVMRARPLAFSPGTGAKHAEFNVLLLRLVIEQVEASDFDEVLRTRVLEPLGLSRTASGVGAVSPAELLPGLIRVPPDPTDQWTTEHTGAAFVSGFYAAAPITSTVTDLMAWGNAYYRTGDVLPASLVTEANTLNDFGSAPKGIALTPEGVCVMLVTCTTGEHEYVGFGQPSFAPGAFSGLFYDKSIDLLTFVLVNNTGTSIRPLYAAVRATF